MVMVNGSSSAVILIISKHTFFTTIFFIKKHLFPTYSSKKIKEGGGEITFKYNIKIGSLKDENNKRDQQNHYDEIIADAERLGIEERIIEDN